MTRRSRSREGTIGPAEDLRARRRRALTRVVLVGLLAAVAEVLPLGFTVYGVVLLLAWMQHRWDATWNDGDAGFAAAAGVVLVAILVAAGAIVRAFARAGGLPPRTTVLIATCLGLAAAGFGSAVLTGTC